MTSDRDHIQPRLAANYPQLHLGLTTKYSLRHPSVFINSYDRICSVKWSEILNISGQNYGCQIDQICTAYSKLVLFMWFGVGWTAGTNARWMGWAEGYKGLQQPWLNIMVQSLALQRLINPGLFGVCSAHNRLGYEGHGGIRDPCVQVLSFRIRFYLVMRHIVQLLRLREDKKRWIHLFSGKRKKNLIKAILNIPTPRYREIYK